TDGVEVAAQGVGRGQVARAHAGRLEAAEGVSALEEAVVDPDRIAVPTANVAGLALEADHPVWTDAIVPGGVRLGPDVVHVAADAGEILTQGGGPAARRAHGIVQPVHQQGVARRGVQVRARLIAQGRRAGADAAAIAVRDDDLVILQEVAGAEAGVTVQRIGDAHPAARRAIVIGRIFA